MLGFPLPHSVLVLSIIGIFFFWGYISLQMEKLKNFDTIISNFLKQIRTLFVQILRITAELVFGESFINFKEKTSTTLKKILENETLKKIKNNEILQKILFITRICAYMIITLYAITFFIGFLTFISQSGKMLVVTQVMIKIIFYLFKITVSLYLIFVWTAIISGELTYRNAIKKKKTFILKMEIIPIMPETFATKKILWMAHGNLTFSYIYIRIEKRKIWKKLIKKDLIWKFTFFYLTGVSWLTVKLAGLVWKNKTKSFEEFLFTNIKSGDRDRLLIVKNGEWDKNGLFERAKKVLSMSLEKKETAVLLKEKIIEDFEKLHERGVKKKLQIMNETFKTNWGELRDRRGAGVHLTLGEFHKEKNKVAWLTDTQKSVENNNYSKKVIVNNINIKKETRVIEQESDDVKIFKVGRPLNKLIILEDSVRFGYKKELLKDNVIADMQVLEMWDYELQEFGNKYEIDKNTLDIFKIMVLEEITEKEIK